MYKNSVKNEAKKAVKSVQMQNHQNENQYSIGVMLLLLIYIATCWEIYECPGSAVLCLTWYRIYSNRIYFFPNS